MTQLSLLLLMVASILTLVLMDQTMVDAVVPANAVPGTAAVAASSAVGGCGEGGGAAVPVDLYLGPQNWIMASRLGSCQAGLPQNTHHCPVSGPPSSPPWAPAPPPGPPPSPPPPPPAAPASCPRSSLPLNPPPCTPSLPHSPSNAQRAECCARLACRARARTVAWARELVGASPHPTTWAVVGASRRESWGHRPRGRGSRAADQEPGFGREQKDKQ